MHGFLTGSPALRYAYCCQFASDDSPRCFSKVEMMQYGSSTFDFEFPRLMFWIADIELTHFDSMCWLHTAPTLANLFFEHCWGTESLIDNR